MPPDLNNHVVEFLESNEGRLLTDKYALHRESDEDVIQAIEHVHRIRYAAPQRVPPVVAKAAAATGFYIARSPVLMEGRIELLHYFINQSICDNYHRYGNLGVRTVI